MKKKPLFAIVLATLAVCTLGALVSKYSGGAGSVYATSHPVAFTAETLTTSIDRSNIEIQHAVTSFAQRADGSSVLLQRTAGLNEPSGTRRILDITRKKVISVDPNTKSISTFHYSDKELGLARNPPASCDQRTTLARVTEPQEKVFGFEVERYSGKLTGADHPVSRWLAPGLNCFTLQQEVAYADNRYQYVQRQITTAVSMGEPDPALFDVPMDYVERSPAEALAMARQQRGLAASQGAEHAGRSLDRVYKSRLTPK